MHWIETLRKNELYDAESAVPDSDENAVRLMTVHGSKGLEFPIVILSGLGGGVRANDGVQLLANHAEGSLEARCTARVGPAFATRCFNGEREKKLEQAQQLRLLYVAATRAREHLVLSLFHSPRYAKSSHAASICNRLSTMGPGGVRPTEITLAELDRLPPVDFAIAAGVADPAKPEPPPESVSPEAHAAAEAVWQAHRQHLLDTLGRERMVTPSGLAHEPAPEAVDPVISPDSGTDDPSPRAWRSRKAATNLGTAVHAVLQWLDLESLSNLENLVAWSAAENGVDAAEVARLVNSAVLSAPIQKALPPAATGAKSPSASRSTASCWKVPSTCSTPTPTIHWWSWITRPTTSPPPLWPPAPSITAPRAKPTPSPSAMD